MWPILGILFVAYLVVYAVAYVLTGGRVEGQEGWVCGGAILLLLAVGYLAWRKGERDIADGKIIPVQDPRWPQAQVSQLAPDESLVRAIWSTDRSDTSGWIVATDKRLWWLVADWAGNLASHSTFGYPRTASVVYVKQAAVLSAGRGKDFGMARSDADEMARLIRDRVGRSPSPSAARELTTLGRLKTQGILTEADWERAKDLYLGKRPSEQERVVADLTALHGLYRSSVLSESEFNMKKWEILSRRATDEGEA